MSIDQGLNRRIERGDPVTPRRLQEYPNQAESPQGNEFNTPFGELIETGRREMAA
jgi:hypothetical protein